MRLFSWNVNGIRAAYKKGFVDWLQTEKPDIIGIQETKAQPEQLTKALLEPEGYFSFWSSAEKKGYSGVAIYCRMEPSQVEYGLGVEEFDREGRTLVAHFDNFVFITAYFPNGSRDHSRVPYKMRYKAAFHDYCNRLRADGKRVIFCGDVNTSHKPIDLKRAKQNSKSTGFLLEERVWIDQIVADGYVDTFRHFYPDKEGAYSWWSYIGKARERNTGWRLDYFFCSENVVPLLQDAAIHAEVMGSDHCPVSLTLNLNV